MGVHFVQIGDEVVVDLSKDTVKPESLDEGVTAHDATGEPIVGTAPRLIVLDDESTVEEFTKALNAYKTYGTTVLFKISSSDFGTLVAINESQPKTLYFMGQRICKATIGDTMSYYLVDIVNNKNVIHSVLTATEMDRLLEDAKPESVGLCYMYMGETTEKYTRGSVYRIGEV